MSLSTPKQRTPLSNRRVPVVAPLRERHKQAIFRETLPHPLVHRPTHMVRVFAPAYHLTERH